MLLCRSINSTIVLRIKLSPSAPWKYCRPQSRPVIRLVNQTSLVGSSINHPQTAQGDRIKQRIADALAGGERRLSRKLLLIKRNFISLRSMRDVSRQFFIQLTRLGNDCKSG